MSQSQSLDWSPEYCLACDRQTDGTAYCSESCRLAEYEHANSSSSESSPSTSHTYRSQPVPNNFYLPSAYDFSKQSTRPAVYGRAQSTPQVFTQQQQQRSKLTPSSSQTSLASFQSTQNTNSNLGWNQEQGQLSEESKQALRAYASSFDQSRYRRRQSTY